MFTVPKRFTDASIFDWSEDNLFRILLENYLNGFDDYSNTGRAPFLIGNSGTGKSHAAAALLNSIALGSSSAVTVGWFPASEAFNRWLDYRDMRNTEAYNKLHCGLMNTDVIVLDDITTLRDAPRLKEYFWMIFEGRYMAQKPTIMTANFRLQEDEDIDRFWDNITAYFGPPFVRRVRETAEGLTLIG